MSSSEERAIRSAAVFEFEEAKQALALLRCKAAQLSREVGMLADFLARCGREYGHLENAAAQARAELERNLDAVRAACDVEAALRLDDEMVAAIARFKRAQAAKKSLGYE